MARYRDTIVDGRTLADPGQAQAMGVAAAAAREQARAAAAAARAQAKAASAARAQARASEAAARAQARAERSATSAARAQIRAAGGRQGSARALRSQIEWMMGSGRAARRAAGQTEGFSSSLLALGGAGGVAIGALTGLTGAVLGYGGALGGAVLEIASFRESSIAAFETVSGSAQEAGRSFRNALRIANQTPLDSPDTVMAAQRFAISGFNERERNVMTAAAADLGAAGGAMGAQRMRSFTLVASQLRASGRMNRGDLNQLLNSGVNTGAVLDSIARQMGIGGRDTEAVRANVLRAITERRVSGETGLNAALDAVQQTVDRGGPLGTFARRQSETLTGALSNLRNAGFNFVASLDFSRIPGVQAFRQAILAITAAFDPASRSGQRMTVLLGKALDVVGGLFGGIDQNTLTSTLERTVSGIERVVGWVRVAYPIVRKVFSAFTGGFGGEFMRAIEPLRALFGTVTEQGPAGSNQLVVLTTSFRGLGQALGFALGTMIRVGVGIATFFGGMAARVALGLGIVSTMAFTLRNAFLRVGTAITEGIEQGIRTGKERVLAALRALGQSLPGPVRTALGIRSPSKVFAELGSQTAAGFSLGISRGTSDAVASLGALVAPPTLPTRGALGGRGGLTVYVGGITVQGATDPEATARAVFDGLEDHLADALDRWAEQAAA